MKEVLEQLKNLKEEKQEAVDEAAKKKKELNLEIDFISTELNQKELESSDLKARLEKREQETRSLQTALHTSLDQVKQQFTDKVKLLQDKNTQLEDTLKQQGVALEAVQQEKEGERREKAEVTERFE